MGRNKDYRGSLGRKVLDGGGEGPREIGTGRLETTDISASWSDMKECINYRLGWDVARGINISQVNGVDLTPK